MVLPREAKKNVRPQLFFPAIYGTLPHFCRPFSLVITMINIDQKGKLFSPYSFQRMPQVGGNIWITAALAEADPAVESSTKTYRAELSQVSKSFTVNRKQPKEFVQSTGFWQSRRSPRP
jgi:hypothetical protein